MRIPQITERVREQVIPVYPAGTEIAGAIGQFAGTLSQEATAFENKIIANKEAIELSNAEIETNRRMNDFRLKLAESPHEDWEKMYRDERVRIHTDVISVMKMPEARSVFEERFQTAADKVGFDIKWDVQTKIREDQKVNWADNITYWADRGDENMVNELLSATHATLLFEPAEKDALYKDANGRISSFREGKAYDVVRKEAYSRGFEGGIRYLNSDEVRKTLQTAGLDPSVLKEDALGKIESGLKSDWSFDKQLESERHQKARGEQMSQAQSDLWGGKLKPSIVKNINELRKQYTNLEDEDQRTLKNLYDEMESEAKARTKGEEPKSDPASMLEAMNIVLDKKLPEMEKENRLRKLVEDKKLTVTDGWTWLQRKKPSEMEKILLEPLQIAYETIIKTPEAAEKIEDLLVLSKTINEVYDWAAKNPNATFIEGKKHIIDYVGEIEKTKKTKRIRNDLFGYYELSRGERKTVEKIGTGEPGAGTGEPGKPGEKTPEVKPPAAAAPSRPGGTKAQPAPKLEENEVLIEDPKTGERFAYNRKTGKRRKL